jgi:hypothetical protein
MTPDHGALFEATLLRGWRAFALAEGDRVHLWSPSEGYLIALPLAIARAIVAAAPPGATLRDAVQRVTR